MNFFSLINFSAFVGNDFVMDLCFSTFSINLGHLERKLPQLSTNNTYLDICGPRFDRVVIGRRARLPYLNDPKLIKLLTPNAPT